MATHLSSDAPTPSGPAAAIPLANGDRLTRDEFERRWAAAPEVKRAELVEGVVYMAAAVRMEQHGGPHGLLMTWLGVYAANTTGVQSGDNTSVRLDLDNELQPDSLLRIRTECGGQSRISSDGYLAGAPEFVAEVAASSSSIDVHDKLHVYRRHGVREYVVWRVLDQAIDWFVLCEGRFDRVEPDGGEPYRSSVFSGLWLDASSMIAGDGKRVLDVLAAGLATPEHAAFVNKLAEARPTGSAD